MKSLASWTYGPARGRGLKTSGAAVSPTPLMEDNLGRFDGAVCGTEVGGAGWRSGLAESGWRSGLAERVGGAGWRSRVGGVVAG